MNWPTPTRSDHDKFCRTEGWQPVRDARGRSVQHHVTYELPLADGRILRTRVSRPVNRDGYGPRLWAAILRDQLDVREEDFWACVREGKVPARSVPEPPGETIPAQVVYLLIREAKIPEAEVAAMGKDEAIARLNEFWTRGS